MTPKQQPQTREGGELKPGDRVLVRGQVMEVALQHFVVAFEARWPGNAITTNVHVAKESVLRAAGQQELSSYGGMAVLRKCIQCEKPYPEFSASSHMRCWECRAGQQEPASNNKPSVDEALRKWANGPFECPVDPKHKLSWRGNHCEECGMFVGAPKDREAILTALVTERTMHNAWRKRAEEAERAGQQEQPRELHVGQEVWVRGQVHILEVNGEERESGVPTSDDYVEVSFPDTACGPELIDIHPSEVRAALAATPATPPEAK